MNANVNDDRLLTLAEAGAQADAIQALEGDAPDTFSKELRAELDSGLISGDEYRAAVIARAQREGWIPPESV